MVDWIHVKGTLNQINSYLSLKSKRENKMQLTWNRKMLEVMELENNILNNK